MNADLQAIRARFKREKVADLDKLCKVWGVSPRTVFRMLKQVGYISSYSHAGRYYTLVDIPSFDAFGIWHHNDIGFSSHGNLRSTLIDLINVSDAGRTHQELEAILSLRVHDSLRVLVHERRIARHENDAMYVYVSAKVSVAKTQIAKRHELDAPVSLQTRPLTLDASVVIDVLLAVIQSPRADAAGISAALISRGVEVNTAQVDEIFRRYQLEKKTARFRSRYSRR